MNSPKQVRVTMYNVGFGDCFLLAFEYAKGQTRRVLIDCGSSTNSKAQMTKVVDQIVRDSGGHVDAVVVTHRHSDHLSAFGLKGVGERLEGLKPELVVQPWTEHPKAEKAALEAPSVFTRQALSHMIGLAAAQEFALQLCRNPGRVLAAASPRVQTQLASLAALSIRNKPAVERLARMGKRHAYVYAGSKSGLEKLLPGVKVSVLGPPTLRQSEAIRKQTKWAPDEFWRLRARLAASSGANVTTQRGSSTLFWGVPTESVARAPSYVRWMIRKLDDAQIQQAKQIVRSLDDVLNNTSVILLFEVGEGVLLFPGDAQLENWHYALSDPKIRAKLSGATVYKVGHHGSTNATPRRLWDSFRYRNAKRQRLVTLLSTRKGKHEGVPRQSLVKALQEETNLASTDHLRGKLFESFDCL